MHEFRLSPAIDFAGYRQTSTTEAIGPKAYGAYDGAVAFRTIDSNG
jgi:hypothetical protein